MKAEREGSADPVTHLLVDLGNTRTKVALVAHDRIVHQHNFVDPEAIVSLWEEHAWPISQKACWHLVTVQPRNAEVVEQILAERDVSRVQWYRSALDFSIDHELQTPETTGADRAAIASWVQKSWVRHRESPQDVPVTISCGTAIVVEAYEPVTLRWLGGAIVPGLSLAAGSLRAGTEQLPLVDPPGTLPPRPWGHSTDEALNAGLTWGWTGLIQSLAHRPNPHESHIHWILTGGDSQQLKAWLEADRSLTGSRELRQIRIEVVPDLVCQGLLSEIKFSSPTSSQL